MFMRYGTRWLLALMSLGPCLAAAEEKIPDLLVGHWTMQKLEGADNPVAAELDIGSSGEWTMRTLTVRNDRAAARVARATVRMDDGRIVVTRQATPDAEKTEKTFRFTVQQDVLSLKGDGAAGTMVLKRGSIIGGESFKNLQGAWKATKIESRPELTAAELTFTADGEVTSKFTYEKDGKPSVRDSKDKFWLALGKYLVVEFRGEGRDVLRYTLDQGTLLLVPDDRREVKLEFKRPQP